MNVIRITKKYFGENTLLKSSGIVFFGMMVSNVLAYVYHLLVGRTLGPDGYGELAAMLSIFYIVNAPSVVLQTILVKYFSVYKARGDIGATKSLFVFLTKWGVVLSTIGFVILMPLAPFISDFLHIPTPSYFYWLAVIFFSFFLTVINISILQAYQRFMALMVYTNIGAAVRVLIGVFAAYFGVGWTLIGSAFTNIIGYIIFLIPLTFVLQARKGKDPVLKKSVFSYSLPALFSIVAINLLYSQDVILVKHFFNSHEAGLYSALSVLGKVIFFASLAISSVVFPVISERTELAKHSGRIIWASVLAVLGISSSITVVYWLFPKFVVSLLFGPAFDAVSPLVGLFGIFMVFFCLSGLLTNIFLALNKTRVWIFPTIAAIAQGVLLWTFHPNLLQVIYINIAVTAMLFTSLLLYYPYARKRV